MKKHLPVLLLAVLVAATRSAAVAQLPTTAPLVSVAAELELYRSPVPALFSTVPTQFDSAYTTRYSDGLQERIAFASQVVAGGELVIEGYQEGRPVASLKLTRPALTPADGLDTVTVVDRLRNVATTYVRQWRAGQLMSVAAEESEVRRVAYSTYDAEGQRERTDGGSPFFRETFTYDEDGRFDTWSRGVDPGDAPALTRAYRYDVREGEDTLSLASVDVVDYGSVVVSTRYTANDSALIYFYRALEGTTELLYRSDDGQDSTRLSFIGRYDGSSDSFVETVYHLSTGFGPVTSVTAPRTPVQFAVQNPLAPGATVAVTTDLAPARLSYQLVSVVGQVITLSARGGQLRIPASLPSGAYVLTARAEGYAPYARPIVIQ